MRGSSHQEEKLMKTVLGLIAVIVLVATGCSVSEQVAVKESPAICAFIADPTCNQLTPGAKGEMGLRWVDPRAQPTQYTKMMVSVVGFFGADATKVKPEEQEKLTALFQKSLTDALATKYQVVEQPGPGTARVQVALLDAEAATPGMRSITMVIPQARLLSTIYMGISGKYPFVGGAQAAFKVTDSQTGQVLGAAVDDRVGGGSIQNAAVWQWGDAENAIKAWSTQVTDAMYAYTSGAKKP